MLRLHTPKEDKRMVDREMLTAMSEMMDQKMKERFGQFEEELDQKLEQKFDEKLKPVYDRLDRLDEQLENNVIPRLGRFEADMKYVKVEQLENNVIPRLDKAELDMRYVRVALLENKIIPQLNTVHSLYLDTSNKYNERAKQIDKMSEDVAVLKSVVSNHSTRLSKIPV